MFCTNCGKQIKEGAAFCNFCGAKIKAVISEEIKTPADPVEAPKVEPVPTAPVEAPKAEPVPAAPVEAPKAEPVPTAPVEAPKAEPVPTAPVEAPKAEPVPTAPVEAPKAEPVPAAPVEAPKAEPAPAAPVEAPKAEPAGKKEKKKDKKKEKKKGGKAKFVLLGILAVIVICGIVLGCSLFPLEVTVAKPDNTSTHTGVIDTLSVTVTSNQPIREIKYALEPENPQDLSLYTAGDAEGSLFEKTLTLTQLHIMPGEVTLQLYVETWFGTYQDTIELECDIGKIKAPRAEDIVDLDWDSSEATHLVVNQELLIGFADGVTEKKAKSIIKEHGGEIIGAVYPVNLYQVHFEGVYIEQLSDKMAEFEAEKEVEYAIYNSVYESSLSEVFPNDGEYDDWDVSEPGGNNWHLECIDAPGAWEHHEKFTSIGVGILDTALYNKHEDLKVNSDRICYLPTEDFPNAASANEALANHSCVYDSYGNCRYCSFNSHGTHVAGIVGALADNGKGVAGTNWNAILHFSNAWTYTGETGGYLSDNCSMASLYYSITYMAMNDCRVINMSLGCYEPKRNEAEEKKEGEFFDSLIAKLETAGYDFLIVKTAGNDTADAADDVMNRVFTYGETAREHVIIVGAIGHSGIDLTPFDLSPTQYNMASFSNYGELVDIVAPGVDIYSTLPDGYGFMSGTSMAAPMVSGVASMIYGANPALTAAEVKEILITYVTDYCPHKAVNYPILNAHLAVERALGLVDETAVPGEPEAGYITGLVQDAATMEILENAVIRMVHNETGAEQVATLLDNGTYYIYAEPGTYTMYFSATDYIEEIIYNVEITNGVETYNVLLNMVPEAESPIQTGIATGYVVDAFDASSIPGATISVYRGIDNRDGELVATIQADSNGFYTLELAPGNYTLRTSAEGYTSAGANMIIIAGQTKSNQHCTLTPILNEGEIRAVLTWGEYPRDLDSHIVGPYPDGYRFHVFYSSKNAYYDNEPYVNLDVDDTTSYGPETTSVYMGVPGGTYTFYVHDYSNRSASYSNGIASSGAVVKVYVGGVEEPYVFNAPAVEGTLWAVFSITDGVLTPVNEMSYHNSPDTVGG